MEDSFDTFAKGAQLGIMMQDHAVQRAAEVQQIEQQKALFPLKMQQIQLQNQSATVGINSQLLDNDVKAAQNRDALVFKAATAKWQTTGEDPQPTFESPESNAKWLDWKAHTDFGLMAIANKAAFIEKAKTVDPQFQAEIYSIPFGKGGLPTPEHWAALKAGVRAKEIDTILKKQNEVSFETDETIRKQQIAIQERGRQKILEIDEKSRSYMDHSQMDPAKRRLYLNKLAVIRNSKDLKDDDKFAQMQAVYDSMATRDPNSEPQDESPSKDFSVADQVRKSNIDAIKGLVRKRTEALSTGKDAEVKKYDNQIKALEKALGQSGGSKPSMKALNFNSKTDTLK